MTSNRMPDLDIGLGETARMTRAAVERFAKAEIASRAERVNAGNAFPRNF